MSGRRSSQSSLSRYASASYAGELENRSMDFCNAFWGLNDPGYEVLLARMRIAAKTIEDLRNFWRERAAIEDDYAKRLIRLSKQLLGQGEVGELKNSLDVVRQETERQAGQHLTLSLTIRKELETSAAEFAAKQAHHRKTYQAPIEKTFKQKQQNEVYVAKAKERYEQDCHRVNAYTAQKTLVQGKDLEKVHLKLERAQSTVETNKRDYQNFTRALADTVARWDKEWKSFCDQCQDLEEERLEFMKDNIWAYANAVSTVCVNEDESCEAMRVALERLEVEKDIEYFIMNHGTGAAIPEAPPFINYTASEPTPLQPLSRVANFARSTTRPQSYMAKLSNSAPEDEPADAGTAGIGAGIAGHSRASSRGQNNASDAGPPPAQLPPHISSVAPSLPPVGGSAPNLGYHQPSASFGTMSGPGPYSHTMPTMAPSSNQQHRPGSYQSPNNNSNTSAEQSFGGPQYKAYPKDTVELGGPSDPIAAQLAKLRENPTDNGSTRSRSGTLGRAAAQNHQPGSSAYGSSNRAVSPGPAPSALSPPTAGPPVDYHTPADAVVGAHPASRPSSPAPPHAAPPHAAMMQKKDMRSPSPIEGVIADYSQAFPGERRLSRSGSFNTESQQRGRPVEKTNQRSASPGGFAGVGANGRSPSPQPMRHAGSPVPPKSPQFNPSLGPGRAISPGMHHTSSVRRAASPAGGISLDQHGNVISDSKAEQYNKGPGSYQQQQPVMASPKPSTAYAPPPINQWSVYGGAPNQPQNMQQQQQQHAPPQVAPNSHTSWTGFAPPPAPPPISNPPQNSYSGYGQAQPPMNQTPPMTNYAQHQHQQHQQQYHTPVSQPSQLPQQGQGQMMNQQTGYVSAPNHSNYVMSAQPQGGPPQGNPGPTQHNLSMMAPQQPSSNNGRPASPMPPTGNFFEDRGILFYVKALYDYTATIEEEFDFQAGDVIAVLATPDDGWWQGILLDDSRRQPGRTVFPSNFVCLF